MRSIAPHISIVAALLLLAILAVGAEPTGDLVVIESNALSMAFDRADGRLVSLFDKGAGTELLTSDARASLFSANLTRPLSGESFSVTAGAFGHVRVAERGIDPVDLTLTFSDCAHADLTAICRFQTRPNWDRIEARIEIENRSDWAIASVAFPSLLLAAPLGDDGADDRMLFPAHGGVVFKNPSSVGSRASTLYPGGAGYQMQAWYDDDAGVSIETRDDAGRVKRFQMTTREDAVDMTPRHCRPEIVGTRFEDAYAIALRPTRAPWHNAADDYKQWALTRSWTLTPLTKRDDLPDWLKKGPPFLWTEINDPNIGPAAFENDTDALLDNIDRYRRLIDADDIIYSTAGWEKHGRWAGIDYFPTNPPQDWWRRLSNAGRRRGARVVLMTSGFKWMVKRQTWFAGPRIDLSDDWRARDEMAIMNADFEPYYNDSQYATRGWVGAYSKVCRGSPEGQDTIADIFARLAEMGVVASSFDQVIGGGEDTPCYSPSHGHPPGFGKWQFETYRDLHKRILSEARKREPTFFLFQENEGELMIPWQGTCWARTYHIVNHPYPHAWGEPVYAYLYHEFITSIGAALIYGLGQKAVTGAIDDETRVYAMARNLVFGQLQGDFTSAVALNADGKAESPASRAYIAFSRPLARHSDYLILGTIRRPLALECATTTLTLRGEGPPEIIELPAVIHSVFEAPQEARVKGGRVAAIIANATDAAQAATLSLPEPYPGADQVAREFRDGRLVTETTVTPGGELALTLPPLGTAFVRFD